MTAAEWIDKRRKEQAEAYDCAEAYSALPKALDALEAVLALHRPAGIFDECDCDDDAKSEGHEDIYEIGLTCNRLYTVCAECCWHDDHHTADCADYHDHKPGEAVCPTAAAIEAALTAGAS